MPDNAFAERMEKFGLAIGEALKDRWHKQQLEDFKANELANFQQESQTVLQSIAQNEDDPDALVSGFQAFKKAQMDFLTAAGSYADNPYITNMAQQMFQTNQNSLGEFLQVEQAGYARSQRGGEEAWRQEQRGMTREEHTEGILKSKAERAKLRAEVGKLGAGEVGAPEDVLGMRAWMEGFDPDIWPDDKSRATGLWRHLTVGELAGSEKEGIGPAGMRKEIIEQSRNYLGTRDYNRAKALAAQKAELGTTKPGDPEFGMDPEAEKEAFIDSVDDQELMIEAGKRIFDRLGLSHMLPAAHPAFAQTVVTGLDAVTAVRGVQDPHVLTQKVFGEAWAKQNLPLEELDAATPDKAIKILANALPDDWTQIPADSPFGTLLQELAHGVNLKDVRSGDDLASQRGINPSTGEPYTSMAEFALEFKKKLEAVAMAMTGDPTKGSGLTQPDESLDPLTLASRNDLRGQGHAVFMAYFNWMAYLNRVPGAKKPPVIHPTGERLLKSVLKTEPFGVLKAAKTLGGLGLTGLEKEIEKKGRAAAEKVGGLIKR